MKQALHSRRIYLPNHRRNYTSPVYMKKILNGEIKYKRYDDMNFVTVPLYGEFEPKNVIEKMELETKYPSLWKAL